MICFTIFGIKLKLSLAFVGLITLMLYIDRVGLMLPTVLAVALHEAGHLMALISFKTKPKCVEIKIGAFLITGNYQLSIKKELVMLMAGSASNFLFSALFYFCYNTFQNLYWLNLSLTMLVMGGVNLLPITGLDGGDILKISLLKFLKYKTVNLIIFLTSFFTAVVIILFGIYVFVDTKSNITLILFGIYLLSGILISKKENRHCKFRQNELKYK